MRRPAMLKLIFFLLSIVCVTVLLTCGLAWSHNSGTIGLYSVEFSVGLEGWSQSHRCVKGNCPVPDHTQKGGFDSGSCHWGFCASCGRTAKKIKTLLQTCLALSSLSFGLTFITRRLSYQIGFTGKLLLVCMSVLSLSTLAASWLHWEYHCAHNFGDLEYNIGHLRVIDVKMEVHYGFIIAILGSISALVSVGAETFRKGFQSPGIQIL
mmetsp:Transcript_35373/g.57068  ORF Transcript_35373/g.57068 Transcript_35373/m.57068 type:complete len:209 (-) Transcript_35373:68-694(-)